MANESQDPNGGSGGGGAGDNDALVKTMMDMFNRGFTAREQKLNEKFEKRLGEKMAELSTAMGKTIEDALAKLAPGGGGEGGGGKSGKGKGAGEGGEGGSAGGGESDRRMNGLEKTVSDLQKELQASKQEKAQLREKSREQNLRTTLREAFHKHGLTDEARVKGAIALWREEGRAKYASDDEDAPIVTVERDKTELDLEVGVASWFKTEEGRSFLPPSGGRGSGDGRGQPGTRGTPGKGQSAEQVAGSIQRWINGEIAGG